ncbi:MAG: hypothetical protein NUV32_10595 [Exilispira sp.]|jgi:hypothetical protein|nr:hypothetical protein [Exilispira sp.]
MKIKYFIFIILLILFSFYPYQDNESVNESNFDYVINGSNIICYNKSISKNEIKDFIEYYDDKVNHFYVNTGLTTKRIELEKMIIILCVNSFREWEEEKICKEKIKKELNYFQTGILDDMIYSKNYYKELDNTAALYYPNYGFMSMLPVIIIKSYNYKMLKYFSLIVEYNHHLIRTNYYYKHIEKYSKIFEDYIVFCYIDDGITNYLGSYFKTITYYEYIGKFNEFLKNDKMCLNDENAKKIFNRYKSKLFYNKNNITFKYINILKEDYIKSYNYNYNKLIDNDINYIVFFNAYLHYTRGTEKFYQYLSYLYNEYYNTKDEIFLNCFNIKFLDFLKEIDEYVLHN